jgi:predicted dienelactone hydrolase
MARAEAHGCTRIWRGFWCNGDLRSPCLSTQATTTSTPSEPGPASWIKRPIEVSQSIDVVAGSQSLAANLRLDSVGLFGGSAGGHTALSMAGGKWSKARFRNHCEEHIREDFSSCVGFFTLLNGNWLDGPKIWLAKAVIAARFSDDAMQGGFDARVKAVVAMVPFAADFDPASLKQPANCAGACHRGKRHQPSAPLPRGSNPRRM